MSGGQKGLNVEATVHLRSGEGGHHSHPFLLVYAASHQPRQKQLFFICRALSHIFSCCPSFSAPGLISLLWRGVWCVWLHACYFWKLRKTVLLLHELGLTRGLGEERRKGVLCKVSYEPDAVTFPRLCCCAHRQGWTARSSGDVHCQQSLALDPPLLFGVRSHSALCMLHESCGWWAGNDVAGKQGGNSQPLCSWRLWVDQPLAHCFQGQQQPGPAASPLRSARLFLSI